MKTTKFSCQYSYYIELGIRSFFRKQGTPKGGVQRDRSGRKWYQSIGFLLTRKCPDFQLIPSILQDMRALES